MLNISLRNNEKGETEDLGQDLFTRGGGGGGSINSKQENGKFGKSVERKGFSLDQMGWKNPQNTSHILEGNTSNEYI